MKKIFFGGPIVTMDDKNPLVEAVYVKDGKIAALGDLYTVKECAGSFCEEVDLQGNTLMPGFIEPHVHLDLAAFMHKAYFIGGLIYDSAEEVIAQIHRAVEETPPGRWIFCYGLDYLINRDLPPIDRYWIDDITTEHPVLIVVQSMHTAFVNSFALELMNITRDTPEPRDGTIYKDENGEPIGVLTEQLLTYPFLMAWLNDWKLDSEKLIREQCKEFKKVGITTVWTAGVVSLFPHQMQLMKAWLKTAPIRQDYAVSFTSIETDDVDLNDIPPDDEKSKFTGIKFWYDGSPYTGNMYMNEDYLENPTMQQRLQIPEDQAGERLFEQDYFYHLLEKYHLMGYQIAVHSQGDRSNEELVGMFARLLKEHPRADHRHRIEHCAFMTQKELDLCAEIGMTLSYHVGHLYYYGEALNELVVGSKTVDAEFMRCRDALDRGIVIALHSDDPMYFANQLLLADVAVTRTTRKGLTMTEDQALSVHEAMRAITIDAAWQIKREKELGSIEEGKLADFVILGQNPYDVQPCEIKDIPVITTFLGGVNTDEMCL